jgi:signal transduction histidine kinase
MTNSSVDQPARRGWLFRLQLASLLKTSQPIRHVSTVGATALNACKALMTKTAAKNSTSKNTGLVGSIAAIDRSNALLRSAEPNKGTPAGRGNTGRAAPKATGQTVASRLPSEAKVQSSKFAVRDSVSADEHQFDIRQADALLHPIVWCSRQSPGWITALCVAAVIFVGTVDYATGPALSFSVFYLGPVSFAAWFAGKRSGLVIAVASGLAWMVADVTGSHPPPPTWVAAWNAFARLCTFAFAVVILVGIRSLQKGLETTIQKRTSQLEAEIARGLAMEREIASVSHREQQRIAHELHDGLGQELGGLAFQAKILAGKLAGGSTPHSEEADRLVTLLNQSIARTRALSSLLDPVGAESGGLRLALGQLADRSGRVFAISCTFNCPNTLPVLSREAELDLYRIAQEAIHNAVQHGAATEVQVQLTLDAEALKLIISDNGRGFSPGKLEQRDDRGMGLRIMQYRAAGLNARLEIESEPGRGCTVACVIPR